MNLSHNSNMARSDKLFRKFQLFSAAVYSLAHGMNDAQKTMGIIAMALFSKGLLGNTILYSHLGDYRLLHDDFSGNHVRRLADC